jgi:hypothetical protein
MTNEQYMDKMDGISVLMNVWNRQSQVRHIAMPRS